MSVRFVLGRAGAGKTHYCLSEIARRLDASAEGPRLVLLVPEQASFQMERALALRSRAGGFSRAEVLSFSRLAQRVFAVAGGEPAWLRDGARQLALRALLPQLEPQMHVLRSAARSNGLITGLHALLRELLGESVSPAQLADAATRVTSPRERALIEELARIYATYGEQFRGPREDAAAYLSRMRGALAQSAWLAGAEIWVDGFAGFTGQELETLGDLASLAQRLEISLLLEPRSAAVTQDAAPDPLSLFYATEITHARLRHMFTQSGVTLEPPLLLPETGVLPRFRSASQLARLEARFGEAGVTPDEPAPRAAASAARPAKRGGAGAQGLLFEPPAPVATAERSTVRVMECDTHREEVRAAARWIRTEMAEARGELHFRDFALIARDLEPFADLVAEVFQEYEIPYFLDRRRPLRAHALSRFVNALLECVEGDFPVRSAARLLATGLLPIDREEAAGLENVIRRHEVAGARYWSRPAWSFDSTGAVAAEADAAGSAGESQTRQDEARLRVFQALAPLMELPTATGRAWAQRLLTTLEMLETPGLIERWINAARAAQRWESAETHRLAWDALMSVLQDVDDLLGNCELSLAEFSQAVSGSLAGLSFGLAPPALDQVLVSSIERSRHPEIRHAWLMAFNEGIFPARPGEDVLLNDETRRALAGAGLDALRPRVEQVFAERLLAYIAFTRPSHALVISYARSNSSGEELFPSTLLADVRTALPELAVQCAESSAPPVTLAEAVRHVVRADNRAALRRAALLSRDLLADERTADRFRALLVGRRYRNDAGPVPRVIGDDAVGLVVSSSQIETQLQCGFKYLVRHLLRIEAARPSPTAWQLGEYQHALLAEATRCVAERGVMKLGDADWEALVDDTCARLRSALDPDLAERRPDYAFLVRVAERTAREVLLAHAERWRRGDFAPWEVEKAFGPPPEGRPAEPGTTAWPGVLLEVCGKRVSVRGKIDRIDRAPIEGKPWLLVYDYKSRATALGKKFLLNEALQLVTYMLAAMQAGERVAGGLLAPLRPEMKGRQDEGETRQRMWALRPRGLILSETARLLDREVGPEDSPIAALRLKKDGNPHYQSDLVSAATLKNYMRLGLLTLAHAAEGLCSGDISVSPLLVDKRLACRECDFARICRFDRAYNRPRLAEVVLPQLSEVEGDA